jgi:hypothetical protein
MMWNDKRFSTNIPVTKPEGKKPLEGPAALNYILEKEIVKTRIRLNCLNVTNTVTGLVLP